MKTILNMALFVVLALSLVYFFHPVVEASSTILVTSSIDEVILNNNCSLREAVIAANTDTAVDQCPAGTGDDIIELPAGIYTLTLAGQDENAAQQGDLDLLTNVTISGEGTENTIIDANQLDRVIQLFAPAQVTLSGLTLRGGDTGPGLGPGYSGGGISLISGSTLVLTDVVIEGNIAGDSGGGLYNNAGIVTLTRVSIRQNLSNFYAGGIRNLGTLTAIDSSVEANEAVNAGGGFFNTGTLILQGVTVSHNMAGTNGGGFYLHSGSTVMENVTVSTNQASASLGGGIWIYYQTHLTATNTTLAYNIAGTGGGVFNTHQQGLLVPIGPEIPQQNGNIHLKNTILANNSGGNCDRSLQTNPIDSLGHNLDSGDTCELNAALGDVIGLDPQLGPLQDNTGPTFTHALPASSPAVDAGDNLSCPGTDQRGVVRPLDGNADNDPICDIGAYELDPDQATSTPTLIPSPTATNWTPSPTWTSTSTPTNTQTSPPLVTPSPTPPGPVSDKSFLPFITR